MTSMTSIRPISSPGVDGLVHQDGEQPPLLSFGPEDPYFVPAAQGGDEGVMNEVFCLLPVSLRQQAGPDEQRRRGGAVEHGGIPWRAGIVH